MIERELPPVEGDLLPAVGCPVRVHLASSDRWVEQRVAGYYVWPALRSQKIRDPQPSPKVDLYRVFVRLLDQDGIENARLLSDLQPVDGHPWGTPIAQKGVKVDWKSIAHMMSAEQTARALGLSAGTSNWAAFMCKRLGELTAPASPLDSIGRARVDWEPVTQRLGTILPTQTDASVSKDILHLLRDVATEAGRLPEPRANSRLATFGALVIDAHRNPDPADIDGGTLQDLAVRAGVLEERHVTEACGGACTCAEVDALPGECYFMPDDVAETARQLTAQHATDDGMSCVEIIQRKAEELIALARALGVNVTIERKFSAAKPAMNNYTTTATAWEVLKR